MSWHPYNQPLFSQIFNDKLPTFPPGLVGSFHYAGFFWIGRIFELFFAHAPKPSLSRCRHDGLLDTLDERCAVHTKIVPLHSCCPNLAVSGLTFALVAFKAFLGRFTGFLGGFSAGLGAIKVYRFTACSTRKDRIREYSFRCNVHGSPL